MIGQQLDLFGGPLRPPKKIKEDEPIEKQQDYPAPPEPTPSEDTISEDSKSIHVEIPGPTALIDHDEDEIGIEAGIPEEQTVVEVVDIEEEQVSIEMPGIEDLEAAGLEIEEPEPIEAYDEAEMAEELPEVETAVQESIEATDEKSGVENGEIQQVAFRGRKTGDPEEEIGMLNVPPDEELFKRQYYNMRETAAMFNVNQALLRFWENEFDILQPKKNKKGDRYFRPIDIKNLVLIYHLLRVRKFTMEGAKDYLQSHKKAGDSFQLVQRLEKLKLFLLELKANL